MRAGEVVGIYGPNGAGKSTLLQALSGLLPLSSGAITLRGQVLGRDLTPFSYHRRIAAMFQEPLLLRGTVAYNVALGLALRRIGKADRKARVQAVLEQLKIDHLADRPIGMISGGRRKGRAWRGRWCLILKSCFSTSLSPRSTSLHGGVWCASSPSSCAAGAWRRCLSPMILQRRPRCAVAALSSMRAPSSRTSRQHECLNGRERAEWPRSLALRLKFERAEGDVGRDRSL